MDGEFDVNLIGVISDTHGLLRPEAVAALRNAGLIIHAGDIGKPEVLEELEKIAPVVAVRGNNDRDAWADGIPETLTVNASGVSIYVLHDLKQLEKNVTADHDVIIAGHSHKPKIERRDGVTFLNPGSSGRRRFKLPVTVALLKIKDGKAGAEIIDLPIQR